MISIQQARETLRLDGADNDEIILSLLDAIPDYIELTTGMSKANQVDQPLVMTVSKFILQLWYNAEGTDAEALQRTIDGLLKTISLIARV